MPIPLTLSRHPFVLSLAGRIVMRHQLPLSSSLGRMIINAEGLRPSAHPMPSTLEAKAQCHSRGGGNPDMPGGLCLPPHHAPGQSPLVPLW